MPNKEKKIKLGKKTNEGYKYKSKIDFTEDISAQIFKLIKEKKVNEIIKEKAKELEIIIGKFTKKEKYLKYYYEIGRVLLFLDNDLFKDIAPWSVYRRIIEELPEILPHIKNKERARKHLNIMYGLAHLPKEEISEVRWDQWEEIFKFTQIYNNKKLLTQIIKECKKSNLSGIPLRNYVAHYYKL